MDCGQIYEKSEKRLEKQLHLVYRIASCVLRIDINYELRTTNNELTMRFILIDRIVSLEPGKQI